MSHAAESEDSLGGTLLIHKHAGVSSFGMIELLQGVLMRHPSAVGRATAFAKKRELPKMGHGGTLDPFATGLLAVCIGRGVKLARYFLGSGKVYEGVIRFGETTIPGDPTEPVSERSDVLPPSLEAIQTAAHSFTLSPYLQTPPMHSAKKLDGKPLYELARQGIEVERKAKQLRIHSFEILTYEAPRATFRVSCSSGTYVRTIAKDLAAKLGTIAMLDSLHRVHSGIHTLEPAMSLDQIEAASAAGQRWEQLPCWVPFDRLLDGYRRAEANAEEAQALYQGKQGVLPRILETTHAGLQATLSEEETPATAPIAIYHGPQLVAVARQDHGEWGLERVFVPGQA